MTRARPLAVTLVGLLIVEFVLLKYGQDITRRRCNPSYTADCDTAGSVVLYAALFLPVVLLVLAALLGAAALRVRRR